MGMFRCDPSWRLRRTRRRRRLSANRVLLPLSLAAGLVFGALACGPEGESTRIVLAPSPDAYRNHCTNPYWPSSASPKLTTPQWVGEDGVEAAAVLSIDDMHSIQPYRSFLEPILQHLEAIDGRVPLSIFTNQIDPEEPQLQRWLERGGVLKSTL